MRAGIIEAPYQVCIREIERPRIRSNEVMIKVRVTGICRSEIAAYRGVHPYRIPPVIPGHEMAGEVVQIGNDVSGFVVGDRVTVEPQVACGTCKYCLRQHKNLCERKIVLGTREWPGSFAEYISVREETIVRIPSHMSYTQATLIEPLAVGIHAVREAGVGPGENVIIFGSGAIGLMTLLAAQEGQPGSIVCTDVRSFNLTLAKKMGADAVLNASQPDYLDTFTVPEGGIDKAIVDVDSASALRDALRVINKRGIVAVVALFEKEVALNVRNVMLNEKMIKGSLMYGRDDFLDALTLATSSLEALQPLVTHIFPIEEIGEAFRVAHDPKQDVIRVVLQFS